VFLTHPGAARGASKKEKMALFQIIAAPKDLFGICP